MAASADAADGQKDERTAVVLTVPHARCPPPGKLHYVVDETGRIRVNVHPCDTAAPQFCARLQRELEGLGVRTMVFDRPPISRADCDLNRLACREHSWRRKVAGWHKGAALLLDVHSFPNVSGKFSERLDVYLLVDKVAALGTRDAAKLRKELVLFDDASRHSREVAGAMVEYMQNAGTLAGHYEGYQNDLIVEAMQAGVAAVLVEVNESATERARQRAASAIAACVRDLLRNKTIKRKN